MVEKDEPLGRIDQAIAAIAAKQHGNVTRAQLLRLGLSPSAITHRLAAGRLHRIFAGVYTVGHRPPSPLCRAAAAVLACGGDAVLSHSSAATLWGIYKRWSQQPIHVTAPSKHHRKGMRSHRSSTLTPEDVTRHFEIAVTTPERTVFDLAPRLTNRKLARAVNDLRLTGHLHLEALAELLSRFPHSRTTARLNDFIVNSTGAPTRSELEDAFLEFAARYDLPRPETNAIVAGHEVDILFRHERLIVELDGAAFHNNKHSFETDRDRDADTLAAGFPTVRVTWDRITRHHRRESRRLKAILKARRG